MSRAAQDIRKLFEDSDAFARRVHALIRVPLFDESERLSVSHLLCSLSLDHWGAVRSLRGSGLLPSALVVHRAQFEATVRSIWTLYGATDHQINILSDSDLALESEQSAKKLPQVHDMMMSLSRTAPAQAYEALDRFKTHSWRALNSYTHAGIHPVHRHQSGYPVDLIRAALLNANGLAVLTCMQAAALTGIQPLQVAILDLAGEYPHCTPAPL
jgi:hypothetical protein